MACCEGLFCLSKASGVVHPDYHHLHPGHVPRDLASTCVYQKAIYIVVFLLDPGNMPGAQLEDGKGSKFENIFCISEHTPDIARRSPHCRHSQRFNAL